MQQHQRALDGTFPPPRHRRRAALGGPATAHRARLRLCDALLRPRIRPPAAPVFRLADAGNPQQRPADGARARIAALRRALKQRANPFRLAAQFVCGARRRGRCRRRERANRRAPAHHVAISPRHRRRQQYGAPCARLRHDRRGRQHPARLHGRHHAVLFHPLAHADGREQAAADQHDLDPQPRDAGHDVCPGRARNLGRPLPGPAAGGLARGRCQSGGRGDDRRRCGVRDHFGRAVDRRARAGGRALPVRARIFGRRCRASVHAARRTRNEHRHRRRDESVLEARRRAARLGRAAAHRKLRDRAPDDGRSQLTIGCAMYPRHGRLGLAREFRGRQRDGGRRAARLRREDHAGRPPTISHRRHSARRALRDVADRVARRRWCAARCVGHLHASRPTGRAGAAFLARAGTRRL